ncbi:MAG TPA: radical SAM protein [Bacteroidales bacterium]|nr:radical SAM protein [Bacteroidales bacterium]
MYDRFNRKINYLRISVTDRCNLRCVYCMPEEGIIPLKHTDILSYEEIMEVVKVAVKYEIDKIRITGGEPLVRKGVVSLISWISALKEITDLSLTTNGILLEAFALPLRDAGLHRVNISLDTMDPDRYRHLTRGGDIQRVFDGIQAAMNAGLTPVKINCVVDRSSDEPDARAVREYGLKMGLTVRFIRRMTLATGDFSVVEGGEGGHCSRCNRLRLTANGKIRPCLFSDLEYDVRELGPEQALKMAIQWKPESGSYSLSGRFNTIGG